MRVNLGGSRTPEPPPLWPQPSGPDFPSKSSSRNLSGASNSPPSSLCSYWPPFLLLYILNLLLLIPVVPTKGQYLHHHTPVTVARAYRTSSARRKIKGKDLPHPRNRRRLRLPRNPILFWTLVTYSQSSRNERITRVSPSVPLP